MTQGLIGRQHGFDQEIERAGKNADTADLDERDDGRDYLVVASGRDLEQDHRVDWQTNARATGEDADGDDAVLHQPFDAAGDGGAWDAKRASDLGRWLAAVVLELADDAQVE